MRTPLAEPKPIWHLLGVDPCGGVALMASIEADPGERALFSDFLHLDGRVVTRDDFVCDNCGGVIAIENFRQLVRGSTERLAPDPFVGAMKIAVQRERRGLVGAG